MPTAHVIMVCPRCNHRIREDDEWCLFCHKDLRRDRSWICYHDMARNPQARDNCQYCGRPREDSEI